jgi:hypothetical protein
MVEDVFTSLLTPFIGFFLLRKLRFSDTVAVGRNQREKKRETVSAEWRSLIAASSLTSSSA